MDKYKQNNNNKKFQPIPWEPYNPEDFSNNFDNDIKQDSDDE